MKSYVYVGAFVAMGASLFALETSLPLSQSEYELKRRQEFSGKTSKDMENLKLLGARPFIKEWERIKKSAVDALKETEEESKRSPSGEVAEEKSLQVLKNALQGLTVFKDKLKKEAENVEDVRKARPGVLDKMDMEIVELNRQLRARIP